MNRAILTFLALGLALGLLLVLGPWWQGEVATPALPPDTPSPLPEPVPATSTIEVVAAPTDELEARIPVPVPTSAPSAHLTVCVERDGVAVGAGITVLAAALPAVDAFADVRTTATATDGCAAFALPAGDYRCRTPHGGATDVRLAPAQRVRIVLEIGAGCTVEGQVTDSAGAPIAGAEILLCDTDAAARAHPVARSDREGAFTFLAGAGNRGVAARHADFAPSPVQRTVVRRGERARVAIVLQRDRGRLLGIVVDAAGTAVADAVIAAFPEPSAAAAPPVCLRTDRAGAFATPPLAAGPHLVLATAAGFGIARVRTTVSVGHDEELRVELPAGATVRGTVRDAAGGPAAGALVWSGQRPSFGSRLARTDDYGFFELSGLPAGAVELTAVHAPAAPGGGGLQRAQAQLQLVAGGASEWNPTLAARAGGTVRGRVEPPPGEHAGGWRVLAQPAGGRSLGIETAEDGTFAIGGLPRGTVDLSVREPGTSWTSFAVAALRSVAVDGPEVAIPVPEAAERSTVRGRILDADARPVLAELRLVHEATKAVAAHATRADGTFEFDRVPAGRLRLEVRQAGRAPLIMPPIDLAPRTVHDMGTVQLPAGAVVQGRILGPQGRAPSALQVRVLDATEHDAGAAEILGDGYRTPRLDPGPHSLIVQADDFAAARVPVMVAAEDQTLDIRLVAGTAYRLRVATRVREQQSAPVSILLYNGERRPIWTAHLPMHGGVAEFRACLEPGSYSVRALGVDGYRASATFRVAADASAAEALTELQLEPPPPR